MNASLRSRTLALTAAAGLSLAAGAAHAQTPAPPPGYGVPYGAPPSAAPALPAAPPAAAPVQPGAYPYGPSPYAPYAAPAYGPPASYENWHRRSWAMAGAGIAMLSVGTVLAMIGSAVYGSGSRERWNCTDIDCFPVAADPGLRSGGIAMIAIGTLSVAAGIPLLAAGLRKVANKPEGVASLVPEIRVGPTGGKLTFAF